MLRITSIDSDDCDFRKTRSSSAYEVEHIEGQGKEYGPRISEGQIPVSHDKPLHFQLSHNRAAKSLDVTELTSG